MTLLLLLASLALQDAPAPPPAPVPSAEPAAAAPALTGAPADDYGFVAWCRGALTGHMEMFRSAGPALAQVREQKTQTLLAGRSGAAAEKIQASLARDAAREQELDTEQQKAGEDYLALYQASMEAAEAAGSPRERGVEAMGQGYRIWSAARASDAKTQMYAYLMWELPGRCETAAKALKEKSSLLGAAFKRAEAPAPPPSKPPPGDVPTADVPAAGAPADPPSAVPPAGADAPAPIPSPPADAPPAPRLPAPAPGA